MVPGGQGGVRPFDKLTGAQAHPLLESLSLQAGLVARSGRWVQDGGWFGGPGCLVPVRVEGPFYVPQSRDFAGHAQGERWESRKVGRWEGLRVVVWPDPCGS